MLKRLTSEKSAEFEMEDEGEHDTVYVNNTGSGGEGARCGANAYSRREDRAKKMLEYTGELGIFKWEKVVEPEPAED